MKNIKTIDRLIIYQNLMPLIKIKTTKQENSKIENTNQNTIEKLKKTFD